MRFPEFKDAWQETNLNSIATIIGGGTPDTNVKEYWNGNIQWFTPTEVGHSKYVSNSIRTISEKGLKYSSAKTLPAGTILLSSRATVGECSISTEACTTNQGFQSLVVNTCVNNEFIFYLIHTKKKELLRKSSGSTFLEISNSEIKKIKCQIPSLQEQKKLAEFLSLVDERIEQQRQLVEVLKRYKRGVINGIFDNKLYGKNWNNYKLSDVLKERNTFCEKDGTFEHVTLSKDGISPKTERYDRDYLVATDDKRYKITKLYDICYNPANMKFGVICLNTYGNAIFSPIYVTFEIANGFDKNVVAFCLTRQNFINKTLKYQQGTVYERMAVSPEDLLSMNVELPDLESQTKLSKQLLLFEAIINKENQLLLMLQKTKRCLLQQMFI